MKNENHADDAEQAIPSMVSNTAAIDRFTAPDSTAKRPNPETMQDRPRKANQVPSTVLEADLKSDD